MEFLGCALKGAQAGSVILRATCPPTELLSNVSKVQLLHILAQLTRLLGRFGALGDSLGKAGIHPDQTARGVGGFNISDGVFLVNVLWLAC